MIKAHLANQHAAHFGTPEWRASFRGEMPWRSCSYCGCMHPEDLIAALKNGGELSGSDWKYGWPHKFYIAVPNPEPEKLFEVASANFKPEHGNYVEDLNAKPGTRWIEHGTRPMFHGKWYNDHLKDEGVSDELFELLAEHARIRFRLKDQRRLEYVAPYYGFQMHKLLENPPPRSRLEVVMAVAQIVDMADVLAFLGKASTATNAEIGMLQVTKMRAEAALRRFLGSNVVQTTYTHYLPEADIGHLQDGRCHIGQVLRLPETPVRSITNLYVDHGGRFGQGPSAFPASSEYSAGEDFCLESKIAGLCRSGNVIRLNGEWPAEPGSIKIVYVAGWSADELRGNVTDPNLDASPIQLAALQLVSSVYNEMLNTQTASGAPGPIKSERLDDYAVEYDTEGSDKELAVPSYIRDLLRPFRRRRVA